MEHKRYFPTFEEMLQPSSVNPSLRSESDAYAAKEPLHASNLLNIHWRGKDGVPRHIVLPQEMTGLDSNLIVLLGNGFPSGSHKVGPAYSILIEGLVDGDIDPEYHTIIAPSTGNFGIGASYVTNLMGLKCTVVMPDNMSRERYERIRQYGADLILTPGTESDVILTLQKAHELKKNEKYRVLAQFESMSNYRFHRHVTGRSIIDLVKRYGNGRLALFTSAPGSAGTLAAGDEIKTVFPEARVAAVEPSECPTLFNGGVGQHRIEGIGDKMCTLIHNIIASDFLIRVSDEQCVRALYIVQHGSSLWPSTRTLRDLFGVSGMCNVLSAIRMAKYLRLGPNDNVVTVATDGFDRYHSVLEELEKRSLEVAPHVLRRWFEHTFMAECDERDVLDIRRPAQKERLFKQKESDWMPFGYSKEYLDSLRDQSTWDEEYAKISAYDEAIRRYRA